MTYSYKSLCLKRIYEAIDANGDGAMTFYSFKLGSIEHEGKVLTTEEINAVLDN